MSIFSSIGSYLDSIAVLSSIFSLDRLRRQIVGPKDPFSLCLCSFPEVGERLIDLLIE
jgi:hypothetical protein